MNLLISIRIVFGYFVFVILKSNPLRRGNWGPNYGLLRTVDIQESSIFYLLSTSSSLGGDRLLILVFSDLLAT